MRSRGGLFGGLMLALLLAEMLCAVMIGPTGIPPAQVFSAFGHPGSSQVVAEIVWQVRLPRVIGAALVGAALGLAGAILQALLRNPLADPYLIGTSSGASLGATIAQITAPGLALVPLGAFIGAAGAALLASTATRARGVGSVTIVLVGYALSVILGAISSLLLTFNHSALLQIYFWFLGGLGSVSWTQISLLLGVLALGLGLSLVYRRELDALAIGEREAQYLGVDVGRTRLMLLLLAGLVTAVAVSAAGLIGFVGLVAPHVARRAAGAAHGRTLALSAIWGGAFLVLADTVARSLPVGEIPVGIVTAIIGGPFFIWLLLRRERGVAV
ncbi:MAG: iron ABC transporter permease [Thermaerobacter sp.]|nr:iron ABC transporter permease [Thermaerobacter sp.]